MDYSRTVFPSDLWPTIAQRIVDDAGVREGDLVLIRDHAGDRAILEDVMLAVEASGGTPLAEVTSPSYLARLLTRTPPVRLGAWDARRQEWVRAADRIIKLTGGPHDLSPAPAAALAAWSEATIRLAAIEDERRIPSVLAAVPTPQQAAALDMSIEDLCGIVLPALDTPASVLRAEFERTLGPVLGTSTLTIRTGDDCVLQLRREGRPWHIDDGILDPADCATGGHVANLPAGALYTTVLEDATAGDLWLEQAGAARDVRLHFAGGRVTRLEAREGAAELAALFDDESGESRRISHVGIGFHPLLRRPTGWVLVDEHIHGALIVAFGENRYLGGHNASSLNVDFRSLRATVRADDRTIVDRGVLARLG